jgi:hypothetical protein
MHKNVDTAYGKGSVKATPDGADSIGQFEGDGYSIRRLSDDEAWRVLDGREGVAAHQDSTEEFLAFLASRAPADDADPR